MLKCSKCGNDAPYAEAPSSGSFVCYECRMIHAWMNGAQTPIVKTNARPVKIGDRVRRYTTKECFIAYRVAGLYQYGFNADDGDKSPDYRTHCSDPNRYPYWTHEDGSKIIPPPIA